MTSFNFNKNILFLGIIFYKVITLYLLAIAPVTNCIKIKIGFKESMFLKKHKLR